MISLPVEAVEVGPRHRKTLGDLTELSGSMSKLGLLHPIVVTKGNRLVAGQRRLEAAKQLGWTEVPVLVVKRLEDARALLEAERDENTCRLDMAVSELVEIGRELEKLERPRAADRMKAGVAQEPSGHVTGGLETRDVIGAALGMSGTKYQRAKRVVEAAEAGDAIAKEAIQAMDKTGQVQPAFNKVFRPEPNGSKPKPLPPLETDRHRQIAEAAKRRVETLVGTCQGIARGLPDLRVENAAQVATTEEVEGWEECVKGAEKALRQFRKRITKRGEVYA